MYPVPYLELQPDSRMALSLAIVTSMWMMTMLMLMPLSTRSLAPEERQRPVGGSRAAVHFVWAGWADLAGVLLSGLNASKASVAQTRKRLWPACTAGKLLLRPVQSI